MNATMQQATTAVSQQAIAFAAVCEYDLPVTVGTDGRCFFYTTLANFRPRAWLRHVRHENGIAKQLWRSTQERDVADILMRAFADHLERANSVSFAEEVAKLRAGSHIVIAGDFRTCQELGLDLGNLIREYYNFICRRIRVVLSDDCKAHYPAHMRGVVYGDFGSILAVVMFGFVSEDGKPSHGHYALLSKIRRPVPGHMVLPFATPGVSVVLSASQAASVAVAVLSPRRDWRSECAAADRDSRNLLARLPDEELFDAGLAAKVHDLRLVIELALPKASAKATLDNPPNEFPKASAKAPGPHRAPPPSLLQQYILRALQGVLRNQGARRLCRSRSRRHYRRRCRKLRRKAQAHLAPPATRLQQTTPQRALVKWRGRKPQAQRALLVARLQRNLLQAVLLNRRMMLQSSSWRFRTELNYTKPLGSSVFLRMAAKS